MKIHWLLSVKFFCLVLSASVVQAAESSGTEAASGGLPQFDPSSWASQIFWLVIFFSLFYLIFAKKIIPDIGNTIDLRKENIQQNVKQAEIFSTKAEAIREAYEASLMKSAHEADTALKKSEIESKEKMSQAIADFRVRYETEVSRAEMSINIAKQDATNEMNILVADIASKMAEKVAGISPDNHHQVAQIVRSLSDKSRAA